jgi:hypothetical protein
LRDRISSRRLKAKIAVLKEELERMGADPAPVHEQVNDGEFQKSWDLLISFLGRGLGKLFCLLSGFFPFSQNDGSFLASFLRSTVLDGARSHEPPAHR